MKQLCPRAAIAGPALAGILLLAGCSREEPRPAVRPTVTLHEAVIQGREDLVRQHVAAGADLNEKEPFGGSSPLITAAAFGRTNLARILITAGADLNVTNNDGATALHTAAFLGRTGIVRLLLEHGADKSLRNAAGATALESVAGPFDEVRGIYELIAESLQPLGLELDFDQIQRERPRVAELLR